MKIALSLAVLIFFSTPASAQQTNRLNTIAVPRFSYGLALGYDTGMPVQGHFMISNFAAGLPLAFRFSISHSFMLDGGSPEAARQVFINENTNGVPSKTAGRWAFGFDMLHRVTVPSMARTYAHGGVRYSRFTSTFTFTGGNEIFDVHANQWGLSAGLDGYFAMNPRVDLVLALGAEYFFPATLAGHDAEYHPNGEIVNQRQDYTYDDADHAINQPKLQPQVLIGVNYKL